MKIFPFRIPKSDQSALIVQEDKGTAFYNLLHQHEEIQISALLKGSGTYIIGDAVGEFREGEIYIIGSNLPHVFRSNAVPGQDVYMQSVFFTETCFGDTFFKMEEMAFTQGLFSDMAFGIRIPEPGANTVTMIGSMVKANAFDRIPIFLKLLKKIADTSYKTLSSQINLKKYTGAEGKRMRDIFEFTMREFDRNIRLEEAAYVANMTRNAFCRYFKQRTNKTYTRFLTELRIENACTLLTKNNSTDIAEIALQCGFNNLANFNRRFKEIKKLKPSAYRKKFTNPI